MSAQVILLDAYRARRGVPARPRRAVQELAPVARGAYAKHPNVRGYCLCGSPLRGDRPCWVVWQGRVVRASCSACGPQMEQGR